jgi:hypothetical protein
MIQPIKKFDPLYTLDSKKKLRVFNCVVKEVPDADREYLIITSTGLVGGKLTEQATLIKRGKQNRSIIEQAIFEAESLWTSKFDEGYKNEAMLAFRLMEKGVSDLYKEAILSKAIEHLSDSWPATNSNWDELPMLAHKFKDIRNPQYPYIIQPKLNGVRCLVKFDKHGTAKLISRGGQYYKIPHLVNELNIFFNNFHQALNISPILDGEIYVHGVSLQEISGAARKEESGLFASNSWLEYHIYDIIADKYDEQQNIRMLQLHSLEDYLSFDCKHIKIVETTSVINAEQLKIQHDEYVADGYEGAILRAPKAIYEFNQRSKGLLKVKEYLDEEFVIVGCKIDENKTIGESFCFQLKNNVNDETFYARPTGTDAMKNIWYNNINDYIGARATVRYFERSNTGMPLQGTVRHKDTEVLHIRPYGE